MVRHTQTICRLLPTSCLSVFEHFVGLVLNELSIKKRMYIFIESWIVFLIYRDNSPYLYERFLWNTAREVIWFLKVNFLRSYFKNLFSYERFGCNLYWEIDFTLLLKVHGVTETMREHSKALNDTLKKIARCQPDVGVNFFITVEVTTLPSRSCWK